MSTPSVRRSCRTRPPRRRDRRVPTRWRARWRPRRHRTRVGSATRTDRRLRSPIAGAPSRRGCARSPRAPPPRASAALRARACATGRAPRRCVVRPVGAQADTGSRRSRPHLRVRVLGADCFGHRAHAVSPWGLRPQTPAHPAPWRSLGCDALRSLRELMPCLLGGYAPRPQRIRLPGGRSAATHFARCASSCCVSLGATPPDPSASGSLAVARLRRTSLAAASSCCYSRRRATARGRLRRVRATHRAPRRCARRGAGPA